MSLYNQVCGNNPLFGLFARVLELVAPVAPIPRFRDMYTREVDGKPQIVIYTRTGGGNRDEYEGENDALKTHPLFVCDFDDDFDSTFAHFVYSVPEAFSERVLKLHRVFSQFPKGMTPKQKFERSMQSLKGEASEASEPTPEVVDELQEAVAAIIADLPNEPSSVEAALVGT